MMKYEPNGKNFKMRKSAKYLLLPTDERSCKDLYHLYAPKLGRMWLWLSSHELKWHTEDQLPRKQIRGPVGNNLQVVYADHHLHAIART